MYSVAYSGPIAHFGCQVCRKVESIYAPETTVGWQCPYCKDEATKQKFTKTLEYVSPFSVYIGITDNNTRMELPEADDEGCHAARFPSRRRHPE